MDGVRGAYAGDNGRGVMNIVASIFGATCRDCGARHRSDVCGYCFARRLARAERCDSRVIAHPESAWEDRLAFIEAQRWPKSKLRAVR